MQFLRTIRKSLTNCRICSASDYKNSIRLAQATDNLPSFSGASSQIWSVRKQAESKMSHECGKHRRFLCFPVDYPWERLRKLCVGLLIFIIIVLFIILVVYLALHPHKPRFYVQDAVIRQWNVTADDTLTSSLQFTIISHNPNDRIGVYYDRISASADYLDQQITPYTQLPPFYQGHSDVRVISPLLYGNAVPLASFIAQHLRAEQQSQILTVNLKIGGKIRWKVGSWSSGHYHLNVNCFAVMGFSSCCNNDRLPLQPGTRCDVDV